MPSSGTSSPLPPDSSLGLYWSPRLQQFSDLPQARCRSRSRLSVRSDRLKTFAEDVLEIVERNGERSAVRGSHLL